MIKKVAKGGKILAEDFNKLVDEINRIANVRVSTGIGFRSTPTGQQFWLDNSENGWMGVVTNGPGGSGTGSGSTDYTDNRYYVIPARITNGEDDDTDEVVTVDQVDSSNVKYEVVTVTNLWPDDTHQLPVGMAVWVSEEYDDGSPPTIRRTINYGWQFVFYGQYSSPVAITDEAARWTYTLTQVNWTTTGRSQIVTEGLVKTGTNFNEDGNPTSGIGAMPNGSISSSEFSSGIKMLPAQGLATVQVYQLRDCTGAAIYKFTAPNIKNYCGGATGSGGSGSGG